MRPVSDLQAAFVSFLQGGYIGRERRFIGADIPFLHEMVGDESRKQRTIGSIAQRVFSTVAANF